MAFAIVLAGTGTARADDVHALARDVDRLESLRQVKDLQRTYTHYAQAGLTAEMASLFTSHGAVIRGGQVLQGQAAIEASFAQQGSGLAPGAFHLDLIDEPLVNLSVDGRAAKARWMGLTLTGDGKGGARIEGGIYENEYLREGQTWKISLLHYHPQFSGDYATGWTNEGGADISMVPYHFTIDESGVPVPPASGEAPRTTETIESLSVRIQALNDEDAVRNLQHAYGYYVDRKMWDDVVELFSADAVVEIAGVGVLRGAEGVRRAMERMGPAGLSHGELNDRPLFDTIVRVLPGGREAISRGFEVGMLGKADEGTAQWEFSVFRNRFVKEDGLWKIRELRLYPVMKADYFGGWGNGGLEPPANDRVAAFAGVNPVTGRAPETGTLGIVADTPLTGRIPQGAAGASRGSATDRLADARRRLARSQAWDGTENVSSAYGYYIDDFQWPNLGAIFAEQGNKQSPFAGYYMGRDRITLAATTMYGVPRGPRAGIAYHWRIQPVILVAEDGRSTNLRTRLFQLQTNKRPVAAGETNRNALMSGMYPNDQAVLENGIWRLWTLEIDEPYFTSAGWQGGWSRVQPLPPGSPRPPPSPLVERLAPDILMTDLGRRAEHFRGGTGETIQWPGILPMWFNYRNPVSGREPSHYWPDCVPCELRPQSSLTRHGYLMPPTGPDKVTPAIKGVVDAGTPVELVREGFAATEGPLPMADGGLLFTENRAGRIIRLSPEGSFSTWREGAGGANALAWTREGEVVATLNGALAIGVVQPDAPPRPLVEGYEGKPFNRPNDLVVGRHGQVYFTDTAATPQRPGGLAPALYLLGEGGALQRVASDIARPNGVALSPREDRLYVADTVGEWILAFDLDERGQVTGRARFARLALPAAGGSPAADGLAVDAAGRLYVASAVGVQVFTPGGESLGIIPLPRQPQNLAFSGAKRSVLFVVGRGAVYRIQTLTHGPDRAGK